MNASLKRLQLDYVDIVFAHRSDPTTPMEETCRALSWLVDQGKAHYWATSGWEADNIQHAMELCDKLGLNKPVAEQVEYNMIWRTKMERDYTLLFDKYRLGTTVYSPMAQGVLSGRYNDGEIPADSRINKQVAFWGNPIIRMYLAGAKKDTLIRIAKGLEEICGELECTQPQLVLAWALASNDVSTLVCGFSKAEQVDENMGALAVYGKWNRELEAKIEGLL
jgi:aryl-alcohol dehydrogenase-like predicted oxidoreductase